MGVNHTTNDIDRLIYSRFSTYLLMQNQMANYGRWFLFSFAWRCELSFKQMIMLSSLFGPFLNSDIFLTISDSDNVQFWQILILTIFISDNFYIFDNFLFWLKSK